MTDERYLFYTDCAEKKRIARGIYNKRTHNGKKGKPTFSTDYLSRKKWEHMNGEVKNYNLGKPMSWKIYKLLPHEIKREYFTALVEKHGGTKKDIALMFGVSCETVKLEAGRQNINFPKGQQSSERYEQWQKFVTAQDVVEDKPENIETEEAPIVQELSEMPKEPTAVKETKNILPIACSPKNGTLTFEGAATTDSLNLLFTLLPKTVGKLIVTWEL